MMMMTKVWPIATAKQRPDVGELVADVAGGDEVREEHRHRDEIDDGQVENEVLRDEDLAHQPGRTDAASLRIPGGNAKSADAGAPRFFLLHGCTARGTQ